MDHIPFLVERAEDPEGPFCGHALMASCPPEVHPEANLAMPFGHGPTQMNGTAQKTWDLGKSDLANLLDLSKRLNLDGEITPVMAWGMILSHPRFHDLTSHDFTTICRDLGGKVRCYGYADFFVPIAPCSHWIRFGAVLEEFEVRDAVESVLYTKPEVGMDVAMAY